MKKLSLLALPILLVSATAHAAPQADLDVSITAPSVSVYQNGSYDVVVSNVGNRHAANVSLTIALPQTNTSPTVHVLGDLGSYDARCSLSGQSLVCNLGQVNKNTSTTVTFDIALPLSSAALDIDASATTTTSESNTSNNSDSLTASLALGSYSIVPTDTGTVRGCTGTNLTSFFECELYPSSINTYQGVFESGGTMSFVGAPDYDGSWSQPSSEELEFTITLFGNVEGEFSGYAVGGSCFEGIMTYPGSSYISPQEVCF